MERDRAPCMIGYKGFVSDMEQGQLCPSQVHLGTTEKAIYENKFQQLNLTQTYSELV